MTAPVSVVIIHHDYAPREHEEGYLLSILARQWERECIEVHHLYGTSKFVPADLAILHVDLSVVPARYADFARRYPVFVNAGVLDIRKRRFSTLALDASGSHAGAVIVKTNLNAGGAPERLIRQRTAPRPVALTRRALGRLSRLLGLSSGIVGSSTYKVYRTAADAPARYYRDPRLIVEKFVPERRGRHYCHRRYYFLGEAEVNQVWLGTRPICVNDEDGVAEDVPVRPELREFRRRFAIEYGKIDYVLGPSDEVVVFDMNKTPWGACSDPDDQPWLDHLCQGLRTGIDDFIGGTLQPAPAVESAPRTTREGG
jgi:hypothetical protein